MTGWDAVWSRRAVPTSPGSVLAELMAADGLDSAFAVMSEETWLSAIRRHAAVLELSAGDSVFEVGCGAGAFLYELERLGCRVAGIDRSAPLIAKASAVMPNGVFAIADAAEFELTPQADVVISFSVFLYFASDAYAEQVVARMVQKARRVVAVFDVPDLATRDADLAHRYEIAGGKEAYAARYEGLEHRYYDRGWFAEALASHGLRDVHVEDQLAGGSSNAPFRFNAWGRLP